MSKITCNYVDKMILKSAVANEHGISAQEVEISNICVTEGSKKGDGFATKIAAIHFEATIDGKIVAKNYIAKYSPGGQHGIFLKQMKAFEQEGGTYTWLIPRLQELRLAKNLKALKLPRCFYFSPEEEIIILENLKDQNYEVVVRKPEPLNLEAIKMVLTELASFHATGHYFVQTYPGGKSELEKDFPTVFTDSIYLNKEFMAIFLEMVVNMFKTSVMVIKKYGSEQLYNRMDAFQKTIPDVMEKLLAQKWRMAFLTHGDAWFNNFFYRYSKDNHTSPTDVAIIDLQNTRIGRPGMELTYFFCSSTSPQQRNDHFDSLFKLYYDSFFMELKKLGDQSKEPAFTLEELKLDYDECYQFGFISGHVHSQVLLLNEDNKGSFDMEAYGDEEATKNMIENISSDVMVKVDANEAFRNIVLGLTEEGAQRNII